MSYPQEFRYTDDHEWAKTDGNTITVGITDHAQSALGDIVFVELPNVGDTITKGENFGIIESVKAVSDLVAPVDGKITETNQSVLDEPSGINQDPHGAAWLVKVEVESADAVSALMDAAAYEEHIKSS